MNDNKLSMINISNMEDDSQIQFQNENANKTDSDPKVEGNDGDDRNLEEEYFKTKRKTSPKVLKQELKWNKKGEYSLCRGYRSGSKSSKKGQKKSTQELEKEG